MLIARPIPVRLDPELVSRLRRASRRMGVSVSGVMRMSIVNQLAQIENGYIRLTVKEESTDVEKG